MIKKTAGIGSFIQQKFPELLSIYTSGLTDDDVYIPPVPEIASKKIKFEQSAPSESPTAAAYVSSEDRNENGVVDTVKIVIPNLEKHKTFGHITPELLNKLQSISPKNLPKNDAQLREIYSNILIDLGELLSHEIEGHIGAGGAKDRDLYGESQAHGAESAYRSRAKSPKKNASQKTDLLVKKELARLTDALADLDEYSLAKSAYKISSEIKKTASDDNPSKKLSGEDLKNLTALLEKQFLR